MATAATTSWTRCLTGPFAYCNRMNHNLDQANRAVQGAWGAATIARYAQEKAGVDSATSSQVQSVLGTVSSGITAFRVPLDVIRLLSGGMFFKSNADGSYFRGQKDATGRFVRDAQGYIVSDPNGSVVVKDPIAIATTLALPTSRVLSTISWLNNTAYQLPQASANSAALGLTITSAIASGLCVVDAAKNIYTDPEHRDFTLAEKVNSVVGSILDLISWIFDTVGRYATPTLGIVGGVFHFVTGFFWFTSEAFTFARPAAPHPAP